MTEDYKNRLPKGMLYILFALSGLTLAYLVIFGICGIAAVDIDRIIAGIVSAAAFAACTLFTAGAVNAYCAVTSNYVYHNIPVSDRQQLLLETLRVLKKGGTFAIHDLMSRARYGDMQTFIENLKKQGYEKAELIDTAQGLFMTPAEAKMLMLSGSTLLAGKK